MLDLPEAVHACLFDLDGVLTDTASVHTKAWKVMFDYQFVVNPAYNRDRGPVSVGGIRVHSEF